MNQCDRRAYEKRDGEKDNAKENLDVGNRFTAVPDQLRTPPPPAGVNEGRVLIG